MLRLSDSVIGRKRFIIRVGGLYFSFGTLQEDEIQNIPSSVYEQNLFVLSWLSDLVVCSTSLYNLK